MRRSREREGGERNRERGEREREREKHDCVRRACVRVNSCQHLHMNANVPRLCFKLRIQESIYPVMLEDWLRVIPRRQMLLVRFEDYAKNRSKELSRVYQFLEMSKATVPE